MELTTVIKEHGPIFDRRAQHSVTEYLKAAVKVVAEEGESDVRKLGMSSFKTSTGNWSSHLNVVNHGEDELITDSNIIYGAWLEGVGSRNHSTRFKGYAMFRKAAQKLQRKAPTIAERILPPFLRKMQ